MDLRKLRHFVTLVRLGSFVRAAEELHLTQPALSRSIRNLEEELGLVLLDRSRTGTSPTLAGRLLAQEAELLLKQARTLRHNLSTLASCDSGHVRFGIGPLPATLFLSELLASVTNSHPELNVSVAVSGATELLAQLKADVIEFFICARELVLESDELSIEPFLRLPLSLLVRADHPLARKESVSIGDLHGFSIASVSREDSITRLVADPMRAENGGITIQCDDYAILMDLALATDVIWIASSALLHKAPPGRLVALPWVGEPFPATIDLVSIRHSRRTLSPASQMLFAKAREVADRYSRSNLFDGS